VEAKCSNLFSQEVFPAAAISQARTATPKWVVRATRRRLAVANAGDDGNDGARTAWMCRSEAARTGVGRVRNHGWCVRGRSEGRVRKTSL
jgi:hypothetical protein